MTGEQLMEKVVFWLTEAFSFLHDTVLFTIGGKPITFWNICISFLALQIFRDFLDLAGVWGYSTEDIDSEYDE